LHCGTIRVNSAAFTVEDQTYTVLCKPNFLAEVVEVRRKYVDQDSRFFNIVEISVYAESNGKI
jgi:hypothetical protein